MERPSDFRLAERESRRILTEFRWQKAHGHEALRLFILGQPEQATVAQRDVQAVMTAPDNVAG